jgi:chromosome segregation ATPase
MKPARRITELGDRLRESASLLARAAAELGAWPAKAAAMVEAALVNARGEHEAAAEVDRDRIAELGRTYTVLERERDELKARVSGLQHSLTKAIEERRHDAATINALEGQLATKADLDAEFDRRAKLLDSARLEIESLVGAVRDRMRRREQQEADAALNRATIAAAVPGFRRAP